MFQSVKRNNNLKESSVYGQASNFNTMNTMNNNLKESSVYGQASNLNAMNNQNNQNSINVFDELKRIQGQKKELK